MSGNNEKPHWTPICTAIAKAGAEFIWINIKPAPAAPFYVPWFENVLRPAANVSLFEPER